MRHNSIPARACVLLAMVLLQELHGAAWLDVSNTPFGMFCYFGSAALADLLMMYIAAVFLRGKLELQILCLNFAAIAINTAAFLLYIAYEPAVICNTAMGVQACVYVIRLLWLRRDDACDTESRVVWRDRASSHKLHLGKATQ